MREDKERGKFDNNIIETFNITKDFILKGKNKTIRALNNINISIKEGEIFGLLGPNGAGKTTFIKILTTLLQPTSGHAAINGYDILNNPTKAKSKIALMLGAKMLYFRITAYHNLKFFCKIYKVKHSKQEIYDIAEEFGLENWMDQYVEKFSGGMKTKLALLRTFLLDRPIMLLDEPTLGLDVKMKSEIIERIKQLDRTILLTTHDMGVVEQLCDRIAFIKKGEIVKIGTKDDIKRLGHQEIKIEISLDNGIEKLKKELNQSDFLSEVNIVNNGIVAFLTHRNEYSNFLKLLSKYPIKHIKEHEPSLEDIFIKLM